MVNRVRLFAKSMKKLKYFVNYFSPTLRVMHF